MTSPLEINEPASNWHCLSDLWPPGWTPERRLRVIVLEELELLFQGLGVLDCFDVLGGLDVLNNLGGLKVLVSGCSTVSTYSAVLTSSTTLEVLRCSSRGVRRWSRGIWPASPERAGWPVGYRAFRIVKGSTLKPVPTALMVALGGMLSVNGRSLSQT